MVPVAVSYHVEVEPKAHPTIASPTLPCSRLVRRFQGRILADDGRLETWRPGGRRFGGVRAFVAASHGLTRKLEVRLVNNARTA